MCLCTSPLICFLLLSNAPGNTFCILVLAFHLICSIIHSYCHSIRCSFIGYNFNCIKDTVQSKSHRLKFAAILLKLSGTGQILYTRLCISNNHKKTLELVLNLFLMTFLLDLEKALLWNFSIFSIHFILKGHQTERKGNLDRTPKLA